MYTHVWYANDFMEMLLFQGIAEMAGREEKSRYELLEISDPSTLLVRGTAKIELSRVYAIHAVHV